MAEAVILLNDGRPRLFMEGEVDISNIDDLKAPLDRLMKSTSDDCGVVIDFCKTTYVDSAVLEVIVRLRNELADRNQQLQVVTTAESQPHRVLRTCRFDSILDLVVKGESTTV